MIDLHILREQPEHILGLLEKKEPSFPGKRLYELDTLVRAAKVTIEELRHEKNQLALQGAAGLTPELRENSKRLGEQIKAHEQQVQAFESEFKELYASCPNIP